MNWTWTGIVFGVVKSGTKKPRWRLKKTPKLQCFSCTQSNHKIPRQFWTDAWNSSRWSINVECVYVEFRFYLGVNWARVMLVASNEGRKTVHAGSGRVVHGSYGFPRFGVLVHFEAFMKTPVETKFNVNKCETWNRHMDHQTSLVMVSFLNPQCETITIWGLLVKTPNQFWRSTLMHTGHACLFLFP